MIMDDDWFNNGWWSIDELWLWMIDSIIDWLIIDGWWFMDVDRQMMIDL
jgi:hypothetical protein